MEEQGKPVKHDRSDKTGVKTGVDVGAGFKPALTRGGLTTPLQEL